MSLTIAASYDRSISARMDAWPEWTHTQTRSVSARAGATVQEKKRGARTRVGRPVNGRVRGGGNVREVRGVRLGVHERAFHANVMRPGHLQRGGRHNTTWRQSAPQPGMKVRHRRYSW